MRPVLLAIVPFLLIAGLPAAAAPDEVDFAVTFSADGGWSYEGPAGLLALAEERPGERYVWTLTSGSSTLIGEIRYPLEAFDIERAKQARPSIDLGADVYPLFHWFPRAEVWDTEGPARVYHSQETGSVAVLRLQIAHLDGEPLAGANLTLERDVTPAVFEMEEVTSVTARSFYLETRTDEPAIADVQVRKSGDEGAWVVNPTPDFHLLQRFPIQGLDPDTLYDVRVNFTDWSDNEVTAPPFQVETLPLEQGAPPGFEILGPRPGATIARGSDVVVEVRLLDGDRAVDPDSVRLFVDLEERRSGFSVVDGLLTYRFPEPPTDGPHTVSVEARTLDGAQDHVKWRFQVGPVSELPSVPPWSLLALVALGLTALRGSRVARGR